MCWKCSGNTDIQFKNLNTEAVFLQWNFLTVYCKWLICIHWCSVFLGFIQTKLYTLGHFNSFTGEWHQASWGFTNVDSVWMFVFVRPHACKPSPLGVQTSYVHSVFLCICGCGDCEGVKSFSFTLQAAVVTIHFYRCYCTITLQSDARPDPTSG